MKQPIMKRRDILRASLTLAGAAALGVTAKSAASRRVRPGEPG
jgi:hypothetical protein